LKLPWKNAGRPANAKQITNGKGAALCDAFRVELCSASRLPGQELIGRG